MSIALVATPSATAVQPLPHAPVLAQLERLDHDLARPDLDVPELLDIHDRAVVLHAYCREVNAAFDLFFDASVARLRAERRVGQLLDQIIASSPAWESHAHDKRMRVPRGLLKQLGISGSQSSRWRYIARLPDQDFEDHLQAARVKRREISTTALVRIARRLTEDPQHGGRPRLSTCVMLRRIVGYMRQIRGVRGAGEHQLLREILAIAERWQRAVAPAETRQVQCLLCARERPVAGAPARCACGGAWVMA